MNELQSVTDIDEVIKYAEREAEGCHKTASAYHTDEGVYLHEETRFQYKAILWENIHEWLEELKERRKKQRPHGELDEFFKAFPELDVEPYNTWNCGADMSKLQANGDQVKNELNRVSKELNSKTEYKAKVKELENAIAKCEKAEEEFKKRTCKFKSPTNCDFCSFHSDCDEHWKEGDEK